MDNNERFWFLLSVMAKLINTEKIDDIIITIIISVELRLDPIPAKYTASL